MSSIYTVKEIQDVFPFLSEGEIDALFPYLQPREWQSGEVLMSDGDTGEYMGFLVEGKLAVKKETGFPGKFILVAVLERGSLVGEISVVQDGGQRNATVMATETSKLLTLSGEQLNKLLAERPDIGVKLLKRIIHVLGNRLRRASDRLSHLL